MPGGRSPVAVMGRRGGLGGWTWRYLAVAALVAGCCGVVPHTHPQAGWRMSGEASGELKEFPEIPVRGYNASTMIRGTVLLGESIYLGGTVTAVIPSDVQAGPGGKVSKGNLLLMRLDGGNTTSVSAAMEHTSVAMFGEHFRFGFGEDTTGRMQYANDTDGEGLFVCGSVVETSGQVAFVARFQMDLTTIQWVRPLKQEGARGHEAECTSVYVSGEAVYFTGNEWVRGDGDQNSFVGRLNSVTGRTEMYKQFITTMTDDLATSLVMLDDLFVVGGCTNGDPDGAGPISVDQTEPLDCWGLTMVFNATSLELKTMALLNDIDAITKVTSVTSYGSDIYFCGYGIPPTDRVGVIFGSYTYDTISESFTTRVATSLQPITSSSSVKPNGAGLAVYADETSIYIAGRTNGLVLARSWGFVGEQETFLMMLNRHTRAVRWVRYGSKEGHSLPSTLACDADQCITAGTYRNANNNGTLFDLMRTPLCGNGSYIEPFVSADTLVPWDRCYYCQPGEYQDVAGYESCKDASPGGYTPGEGFRLPILAPVGYYVPGNKSSNATIAPAGSYVATEGSSEYQQCPAGSYNPDEGASACSGLCPAGYASSAVGATSNTTCTACPAGSYAATAGMAECALCSAGSYQPNSAATACIMCGIGTYANVTGAVNASQCIDAPVGHYVNQNGSALPVACPGGEVQNKTGQTACHQCPPGYEANSTGLTACSLCPPGTSSAIWGTSKCEDCSRGESQALAGQTQCDVCPEHTYTMSTRSLTCISCPANSFSPKFSQDISACNCEPDYYGSPQHGRPCKLCPPQTTCGAGDQYPRVKLGMWARTDDPENLLACIPIKACPGGAPRDLPNKVQNSTALAVRVDAGSGMLTMGAEDAVRGGLGGDSDAMVALSTASTAVYTSSCLEGYEGEACSYCSDGFFRTKGKCEQCNTSSIPSWLIYAGVAAVALGAAVAFLVLGLWKGAAVVLYRRHRQVLHDLVSNELNIDDDERAAVLEYCQRYVAPTAGDGTGEGGDVARKGGSAWSRDLDTDDSEAEDATLLVPRGGGPAAPSLPTLDSESASLDLSVGENGEATPSEPTGRGSRVIAMIIFPVTAVRSTYARIAHRFRIRYNKLDRRVVFEREKRPVFSRLMAVASKAIKFAQLYSVLLNINVTWPDTLKSIGSALQIISLDINDIVSVQCATNSSAENVYRDRYVVRIFLPLGLIVLNGAYAIGGNVIGNVSRILRIRKLAAAPKNAPWWRRGVAWVAWAVVVGEDSLIASVDHFIFLTMLVAIVAYITIHAAVMEIWTCTHRSNGRYFLVAEPTIQCFVDNGVWIQMVPVSVVCFFLLSLGIPLVLVILLYTRHPKRHQPAVATRYSFLWSSYMDDMYAWEIVMTAFKVILVMALPLSVSSAGDQLTFMLFLCVIFFILHLFYLPHRVPSDNYMEALLMCSVVVLTIAGIIFDIQAQSDSATGMSPEGELMLEYLLLLFMTFVLCYFVYTALGGQVLRLRAIAYWNKVTQGGSNKLSVYSFIAAVVTADEGGEEAKVTASGAEVLQYMDGVYLMGQLEMGSTLFVPASYKGLWTHCAVRIARGSKAFALARKGSQPSASHQKITIAAAPGAGSWHFGVYLLRMMARRENGLNIPIVHFVDPTGGWYEINLQTVVVRPLKAKTVGKAGAHPLVAIVCGHQAAYTPPPTCVAVIRLMESRDMDSEEARILSGQAAAVHMGYPPPGDHLVLCMPAWHHHEMADYGELIADTPDPSFVAARSILLSGSYPGRFGDLTTTMWAEREAEAPLLSPGAAVAAIDNGDAPSLGQSLLLHCVKRCPGALAFANVSFEERGRSGGAPAHWAPSLCLASEQLVQFATANINTEWRAAIRLVARVRQHEDYLTTLGYQRQIMRAAVSFLVSNGCVFNARGEDNVVELWSNGTGPGQGSWRDGSQRRLRLLKKMKSRTFSNDSQVLDAPTLVEFALPVMNRQWLRLDGSHQLVCDNHFSARLAPNTFYYLRRCTGVPRNTLGCWEACRVDGVVGFFVRADAKAISVFAVKSFDTDPFAVNGVPRDLAAIVQYVVENEECLWPQVSTDGSAVSKGWWSQLKALVLKRGESYQSPPLNHRNLSSSLSVDEPFPTGSPAPRTASPVSMLGRDLAMQPPMSPADISGAVPPRPRKMMSVSNGGGAEPMVNGRCLRVVLINVVATDPQSSLDLPSGLPSISVRTRRNDNTHDDPAAPPRVRVRVAQIALGVHEESRVEGNWAGDSTHQFEVSDGSNSTDEGPPVISVPRESA